MGLGKAMARALLRRYSRRSGEATDPDDEQGLNWEEVEQAVEDLLQENEENDENGRDGRPASWFSWRQRRPSREHMRADNGRVEVFNVTHQRPGLGAAAMQIQREVSDFDEEERDAKEESMLKALEELPEGEWTGKPFECVLCLDTVDTGDRVRTLQCFHCYHTECIDQWLRVSQAGRVRRCPLCNTDPFLAPADRCEQASAATSGRSRRAHSDGRLNEILWGGVPVDDLLPSWAVPRIHGVLADRLPLPPPSAGVVSRATARERASSLPLHSGASSARPPAAAIAEPDDEETSGDEPLPPQLTEMPPVALSPSTPPMTMREPTSPDGSPSTEQSSRVRPLSRRQRGALSVLMA